MLRQTFGVPHVRSRLLAGCAAAAITCAAHADWWVSDSTGDTYVDSAACCANTNYGSATELFVGDGNQVNGTPGTARINRAYLKFDICNMQDHDISSAKLKVYVTGYGPSAGLGVNAHEMLSTWSEGTVDWNDGITYATSWTDQEWINASGAWFEWDLTTLAWKAQDGDGTFSVVLMANNETTTEYVHFYSRESAGYEPYLDIVFTQEDYQDPEDWDLAIPDPDSVVIRNPFDGLQDVGLAIEPPGGWVEPVDVEVDSTGTIYVSDRGTSTVHQFDAAGNYQGVFADPSVGVADPSAIAFHCGRLGIACQASVVAPLAGSSGSVELFDGAMNHVGTLVDDDSSPHGLLFLPDGRFLLSDDRPPNGSVRLYEADGASFVQLFTIACPRQLAYRASTGNYLVACTDVGIVEFNLAGDWEDLWSFPGAQGVAELGNGRFLVSADSGLWSMNPDVPADLVQLGAEPSRFVAPIATLRGVCCFDGGSCDQLPAKECAAQGGDWQGAGTTCATITCPTAPDSYVLTTSGLTGVHLSDAQWADFDRDGDPDLVISGRSASGKITRVYENQAGTMVPYQDLVGTENQGSGALAWGDYDLDGDLDLAVAGLTDTVPMTKLYAFDPATKFTEDLLNPLVGVKDAAVAWGDYDLDGDLDLVVTGNAGSASLSTLYRNEPTGTLVADVANTLVDLRAGSADWADVDGDGDLDLLLTGSDNDVPSVRRILFYENDPAGTLTDTGARGLPGMNLSDAAFGDFDGDGDLDLACTGDQVASGAIISVVCENDGLGSFTQIPVPIDLYRSMTAWGDWENDGDLDVLFAGNTGASLHTALFPQDAGTFPIADARSYLGRYEGSVSFADVDQDDDLDFLVTGYNWFTAYAEIYEKRGGYANTAPSVPAGLVAQWADAGLRLSWSPASDAETPSAGITYAVRVGTAAGGDDVMSGQFGTPLMGNVGPFTTFTLDVPNDGYFWSVRAIDGGLLASGWADEARVDPQPVPCPMDVDGNGSIGFFDLNAILSAWGPCPAPCAADLDGNGSVGFADLTYVLAAWGPCES